MTFDLDTLVPAPIKVRWQGKEYALRTGLTTEEAVTILRLVDRATKGSAEPAEVATFFDDLARAVAGLMTDDEQEREHIRRQLTPAQAAQIARLVLFPPNPQPEAAEGEGERATT